MAKVYYVDSENVGDSRFELLNDPEARILVFYTGHTPRIAYPQAIQLMNAPTKPEFIECREGNNGLDFQLVTYLGYELRADQASEIVIVSNDTGFDAVVSFWSERGMQISRAAHPEITSSQSKQFPVADEKKAAASPSEKTAEQICGVDREEICTIIHCVGSNNSSDIHLALVHFYGIQNGDNIYKVLKKEKFSAPAVSWKKEVRRKTFIEMILQHTNTDKVPVPETFVGFLANQVTGDKKAMRARVVKQFPAQGAELHKMFKPFYSAIAKIK